jgi:membrane protease YdiL (CAAX protease family)
LRRPVRFSVRSRRTLALNDRDDDLNSSIKIRQLEFGLILFIAIGPLLAASIFSIAREFPKMDPIFLDLQVISGLILEIGSIALLIYVLFRQNRSLSELGFAFNKRDIIHSIVLVVVAFIANYIAFYIFSIFSQLILGHGLPKAEFQTVLDSAFTLPLLLFILVNPFFEELIVRAYLITEIEFFSKSAVNAVLFSVFIQVAYHLYQGVSNALTMVGVFSIFSIYYIKKRRIWPIILAHAYFDLYAYILYLFYMS